MFKISSEISLASASPVRYQGMAYDGCHFFLSKRGEAQVVQLDDCFQVAECFPVHRCYDCLCYDTVRCCFWASGDKHPSVLFKLDRCFREIDRFLLKESEHCGGVGVITNINYVCRRDALLLSTSSGLVWVSVTGRCEATVERQTVRSCNNTAQRRLDEGGACVCGVGGENASVRFYFDDESTVEECLHAECFCFDNAIICCGGESNQECCLYILARKHGCYPYLLICTLEQHCCCSKCCFPCLPSPCPPCPCPPCPCPPHPPCPNPPIHPCADLLESIALMEAALSHVLNAEGEKLQKAIAETGDLEMLLKMNETVRKTLIEATHLEQVLYHKLELAHEICDSCKCEEKEICI